MTRTKIRKLGLWSSVVALVALGLAVIADNRNLGFGLSITRRNQLGLLAAAITLCTVQFALNFFGRRKEDNHGKRYKRS
jgi:hypothetical protein